MRVVYVNLHTNVFMVKELHKIILNKPKMDKHRFALDGLIENGISVANLVTLEGTTLKSKLFRTITRNLLFRKIEAEWVLKKNNIPLDKIEVITDPNDIEESDIIIMYSHFNDLKECAELKLAGRTIVDLCHIYGDAETADKIAKIDPDYFMYEVNLQKYSAIYRKNYSWFHGEIINRPYAFKERFKSMTPFRERKRKAVAMGTVTVCNKPDFVSFYGSNIYQPQRKKIMDGADKIEKYVDSHISFFDSSQKSNEQKKIGPIAKIIKVYNYGRQKEYFSFDMVQKYNEYMMFVCPEDIHGSYGIGVLEGMASGCALLGTSYGGYEELGLEAGRDYIQYDGSIEDLAAKIEYYTRDDKLPELERIANSGRDYIIRNYSEKAVKQRYCDSLLRL